MKRIVTVICAFCLVWLSGCTGMQDNSDTLSNDIVSSAIDNSESGDKKPFTLAYSSNDTLNPYDAETSANLYLCSLLYDGLISFDSALSPNPKLAAAIRNISETSLAAELKMGIKFSDGTDVTTQDIIVSYSLAKDSKHYKALLTNIKSVKATDNNNVVFELKSPDNNALACLGFPIIKPKAESSPVGTGLFMFVGGEQPCLKKNPHNSAKPKIDTVGLLDSPVKDATIYALENGSISYFFSDLSDGSIPQISSANIRVPLNSLVFIGINSNRTALSDAHVRSALSAALNRKEICSSAFAGRARPAKAPFNPSWAAAANLKGFEDKENISNAVAQIEQSGYNNKDMSFELLTSNENSFRLAAAEMLVKQLGKAGIDIKVKTTSFSDYLKRIKAGNFQLYLGDICLTADMSLRPFFTKGGNTSYGLKNGDDTAKAYAKYLSGQADIQQFTDTFVSQVPFIPLCWRDGMAAFSRMLTGVSPTAFDIYHRFDSWDYSA